MVSESPEIRTERDAGDIRAEIVRLAEQVELEDGAPPLSDQALSRIGADGGADLVARMDGTLVGYARVDDGGLEIAAAPDAVAPLLAAGGERATTRLLVWSHGRRSRLVPVLEDAGYERVRELHQLRRPLDESVPLPDDPPLPDGVSVRPFRPGADDDAWLALNAAAFAEHREQGGWTSEDLRARMAEPWFDAAGFLLADRDGDLLAFHWTKIHPDGAGEVYVLGVAPAAQGLGLGGALLVRGLRHLQQRGCPAVLLYVDGDNAAAMHLYERDGFVRYDLDVQWQAPA